MSDEVENIRRQHMQRVVRAAFTYRSALDGYYRAEAELSRAVQAFQGEGPDESDSRRVIARGATFAGAKAYMVGAQAELVAAVDSMREAWPQEQKLEDV